MHGDVSLQKATQTVCEPTHFWHLRYCLSALNVTRPSSNRLALLNEPFDFSNTQPLRNDSLRKFDEGSS